MAYINTEHLFKCETCRRYKGGKCLAWSESRACYSLDMTKIPTADVVEAKHGKWIHKKIDKTNWRVYGLCSRCLERNRIGNYCRNCGAKMGGERKDT